MIKARIKLGLPIILSQGILTLMVLCDRFILSLKNPVYAAASTTAGFTAISLSLFFINFLSFGTSLVAKKMGNGDKKSCLNLVNQTLTLALIFSPLLILLSIIGIKYFTLLGHQGIFKLVEVSYFKIILYSQVIILFKTAIENYYIGIQSAGCILKANLLGLFTNGLFSYLFVLGPFSTYFAYADGAAWGTFVSSLLSCIYLFWKYGQDHGFRVFNIRPKQIFNSQDMMELSKQGTYIGLEKFFNSFCFVFFVNLFVVYGNEISTSISTIFSWDQISYLPLLGIYSAIVSIFSRYLGENDLKGASSSLSACLEMTYILMLVMSIGYFCFSQFLTGVFLKGATNDLDVDKIYAYSSLFFKTTFINVFCTATSMLYKAALRSLGFSLWCFVTSSVTHLMMCVFCYVGVYYYKFDPFYIWAIFLFMMTILGLLFVFKFHREMRQLKVKNILSVDT